jgi:hypothetical protein
MSAAIWPWLARKELASAVTLTTTVIGRCSRAVFSSVLCPQRLDLHDTALVLGADSLAALVRDAEQRALELARDPLQVFRGPCRPAVS